MRSRKASLVRKRTLASSLFGGINVHDQPVPSQAIRQATGRSERRSGHEIGEKERAQSLDGCLIQRREKTRERRAIGQMLALKEGHEDVRKRCESLVKGF